MLFYRAITTICLLRSILKPGQRVGPMRIPLLTRYAIEGSVLWPSCCCSMSYLPIGHYIQHRHRPFSEWFTMLHICYCHEREQRHDHSHHSHSCVTWSKQLLSLLKARLADNSQRSLEFSYILTWQRVSNSVPALVVHPCQLWKCFPVLYDSKILRILSVLDVLQIALGVGCIALYILIILQYARLVWVTIRKS